VKLEELVPVPAGVVTDHVPLDAPLGTDVEICPSETTVNAVEEPPIFTLVAPVKPDPVSVTEAPAGPLVGVNEETTGAEGAAVVTVKLEGLVPVPAGVVTDQAPLLAPLGTDVEI